MPVLLNTKMKNMMKIQREKKNGIQLWEKPTTSFSRTALKSSKTGIDLYQKQEL